MKNWPIFKMSKHRQRFIDESVNYSYQKIVEASSPKSIKAKLEKCIEAEIIRSQASTWKVDDQQEINFWLKKKRPCLTTWTILSY